MNAIAKLALERKLQKDSEEKRIRDEKEAFDKAEAERLRLVEEEDRKKKEDDEK